MLTTKTHNARIALLINYIIQYERSILVLFNQAISTDLLTFLTYQEELLFVKYFPDNIAAMTCKVKFCSQFYIAVIGIVLGNQKNKFERKY